MSHFTEIKTQIKAIEALRLACKEMGLTLLQNAEARGYYENKTRGDYVIKLTGPYDIALKQQDTQNHKMASRYHSARNSVQ